jgi:4-hydroxy-3-methylbut-2-enyl diphosphate reductase IspH
VWNAVDGHKRKEFTSIIHGKWEHEETVATASFAGVYCVVKDMKVVTRNPQPTTRNPQPATRNPQPATHNSQPTPNPQLATNLQHRTTGPEPQLQDPDS